MILFKDLIETLRDYTKDWSALGIIRLCIDLLLVGFTLFFIYKLLRAKIRGYKLLLILLGFSFFYLLVFFLQLELFLTLLNYLIFWSLGLLVIIYTPEIRHSLEYFFSAHKNASFFTTKQEKREIINILLSTVEYLSKRRMGALITIEREENLNNYIEKAIEIKGTITQELLTTIFTPGTACHDGAVIIRKNKIMCAGAYLPSTDKYDVPKSLGTRHRAAIGISERSDAFTIVVSEETGNVSVTIDGNIMMKINIERLEELLDRYLILK
ncbi:MAG: diadenylate cyclase CdaA [Bacilli bacterium]|jgi:diadenylate cyclase|nr:TIGR00159 family protein [Acholeplasmataceae bacterium]